MRDVVDRTEEIRAIWEQQPESFPVFLKENPGIFPAIDIRQKQENEALVQELSQRLKRKLQRKPAAMAAGGQPEQELEQDFMDFLGREKILSLSEWMSPRLLEAMRRETKHFISRIRSFDETLEQAQLWQALRNYFIYAMIVEMQGEEQNADDPILAYSLLYPYTDNYMDDAGILARKKERYHSLIAAKLTGKAASPENFLEEKTCCLLDMVLGSYEGERHKRVAETLLQLAEAQVHSVCQQSNQVSEEQILTISIRKGSLSVLADYLFAASDWREEEELFYLKFGFLLQLVDDLQDIREDREHGSHTLMTQAGEKRRLERYVNRLLWYSWNVICGFEPRNPGLKGFILKNCVAIILLAAARSYPFFSAEYLKGIEPYLPFSLRFMKKGKSQNRH